MPASRFSLHRGMATRMEFAKRWHGRERRSRQNEGQDAGRTKHFRARDDSTSTVATRSIDYSCRRPFAYTLRFSFFFYFFFLYLTLCKIHNKTNDHCQICWDGTRPTADAGG